MKIPNPLRKGKKNTEDINPNFPGASELFDTMYGNPNSSKSSYIETRKESAQKDLERINQLMPDLYEAYQGKLESQLEKFESKQATLQDIIAIDKLIDTIRGTRVLIERRLINSSLQKLLDEFKSYFNAPAKMVLIGDEVIDASIKQLTDNTRNRRYNLFYGRWSNC